MDKEKLQEILIEHKKWVDSDGGEGKCANLQRADLQRADLQGACLQGAYLQGANLQGANLQGADLWGALFSAGFYQVLRRVHGSDSVF